MYEDLIKMLRTCAERDSCVDPLSCPYLCTGMCANKAEKAADAIEELSKQHEQQRQNLIALMNEKPRWIPVTERLPEKNGVYLVYVYREVTEMNYWHGKWHMLRDDYTKAVTHWMPLPEPPKEEV